MRKETSQLDKRSDILRKIIPLLFLPAAGLMILLTIFIGYIDTTEDNNAFINVAGRQRLIAHQLGIEAHMVGTGDYEDIEYLQQNMQKFASALQAIEFGHKDTFAREISALPDSLISELADVKSLWHDYSAALQTIIDNPSAKESLEAYQFIKGNTERLVDLSDRLVNSYEARVDDIRRQIVLILVIFIVAGVASILAVIVAVRRFVYERRQIELELEKNRERFALAVHGTSDGIWDWDLKTGELYLSERWKEMLGYEPGEISDDFISWRDLIHPDDLGRFLTIWSDYMEGVISHFQIEYRLRRKEEGYAWILCRGLTAQQKGGAPDRLSGSHTDISVQIQSFELLKEEKRQQARLLIKLQEAQENIQQSEERLRYSQYFSNVGNVDWNIEKDELYLSELSAQMLGYRPKEQVVTLDDILQAVSSADGDKVSRSINDCRYEGIGYDLEFRIVLPDGEERWLHGRGDAIRDEGGHATNILGMLQDITSRKHAELRLANSVRQLNETNSQLVEAQDNLKKSTEWLQSILDIAPEAIIVFNSEQCITVFNRGAESIFGYRVDEVIGKPLEMLISENFHVAHPHLISAFGVEDADTFAMGTRSELIGLRKDGSEFPAGVSVSKIGTGDGNTFTVIIRDLTKQKESEELLQRKQEEQEALIVKLRDAQEQLLQSEKMASIGQLAAGVAHEINNPVGYINSNLSTLQNYLTDLFDIVQMYQSYESIFSEHEEISKLIKQVEEDKDLEFLKTDVPELLNESLEGVVRVKQIVQDLKNFSHVDDVEWHMSDLHKGIDSTINVAHNELKYKADVVKVYGELPEIECIISQINQVIMNLLVNAAHAIEEHGTITIRTGVEGEGVWIEIEDTGKGMDDDIKKRVFDPFFTTKPVGSGTGLGLSLSYGIIQKHNGTITVNSEVGKGSTFHIWLPIKHTDKELVE